LGNGILKRIASWGFDYEAFGESGDYSLRVFETLAELKPHISDDLYRAVSQAMEGPDIEDLDI
jgi:EXLDI family protein